MISMSAIHNSFETVNAAATAIVTAESRVQPTTVRKKRWGSFWSLYWCFGSYKQSKRISNSALVPEPALPGTAAPTSENSTHPSTVLLPFIAPPSSPASFLQSDPPSGTQTPGGLLALTCLSANAYSPSGPASIFAIGPYAHETQLVSPPVFSTFTTEPSTASFTPPPESVQTTRPSSPEVPFAQLLASSLGRARRNSGPNKKFSLSQYEFQPYQLYQGSPVSNLVSPGSVVSNSGTSSPFLNKNFSLKFHIGEVPKVLGLENFSIRKWGSRLGSGSLTPEVLEPVSRDSFLPDNQISEVASLANSETASQNEDSVIDHRVSFELNDGDARGLADNDFVSSIVDVAESLQHGPGKCISRGEGISEKTVHCWDSCVGEAMPKKVSEEEEEEEEEQSPKKYRSISFGSIKEFNFDNSKGEFPEKSDWWANEKVITEDLGSHNDWTFFPVLQSGVI